MEGSARRGLVIIDVQKDFCPGGALAVAHGDEIIPLINAIAPRFSIVVATQDWHPAGHVSFASAHPGRRPLERIVTNGIEQVLWPDHCVQGSPGASLHPLLDERPVGLILRKGAARGLDSYSAFFENDRTTQTGLAGWLRAIGCEEVYLAGLATDYCVLYSALDAVRLGFQTTLLTDAVKGVDLPPGSVGRAMEEMAAAGIRFRTTSEIP